MNDTPEGVINTNPEVTPARETSNNGGLLEGNPSETFRLLRNINQAEQRAPVPSDFAAAPRLVDPEPPPHSQPGTGESPGTVRDASVVRAVTDSIEPRDSRLERFVDQSRPGEEGVRRSVVAGIRWMDANPHAIPIFEGPVHAPANDAARALERAILDAHGQHSGSTFVVALRQVEYYRNFGAENFFQKANANSGGSMRGRASAIVGALGLLPLGLSTVPQANEFRRFQ